MAPATFAIITSFAFATEVFLKVLAQLEHGKQPLETHHLRHLFNDLSVESQDRLRREWTEQFLPGVRGDKVENAPAWMTFPQSFDECLNKSARAFVDWRYATGTHQKPLVFHLMGLPALIRAIILEMQPEFAAHLRPASFDPEAELIKPENDYVSFTLAEGSELDRETLAFDIKIRPDRSAYTDDSSADEAG